MKKKTLNVHPGELLREEFLTPLGITAYRLAKGARLPVLPACLPFRAPGVDAFPAVVAALGAQPLTGPTS